MIYGKTLVKTQTKGKTTTQGSGRCSRPKKGKKAYRGQGRR